MRANDSRLAETIAFIARFYDSRKYGYEGLEGYRKSADLRKFTFIIEELRRLNLLRRDRTVFLDLGCADGRVNLLLSYFVRKSLGIEIDSLILDEYEPRRQGLIWELEGMDLLAPPGNISLFAGSSLERLTYDRIAEQTGIHFTDVDLFYTYITLHDLFGEMIASNARDGALFLVYGFHKVLPRYDGLEILIPDVGSQSIATLYRRVG